MGELPTGYIGYPEDPDYEMAFMREKAERERDHARAGLREIQELHCDDGSGNCEACFFPGKEGDWQSVKHPCTTRQLADKALGGAS